MWPFYWCISVRHSTYTKFDKFVQMQTLCMYTHIPLHPYTTVYGHPYTTVYGHPYTTVYGHPYTTVYGHPYTTVYGHPYTTVYGHPYTTVYGHPYTTVYGHPYTTVYGHPYTTSGVGTDYTSVCVCIAEGLCVERMCHSKLCGVFYQKGSLCLKEAGWS